ncbi:baseplate wedge subunit [Acinetobacter phage vB_AbaM_PhT2]|uniref:Baseplate wedge protein gp6 n=1 Tax=Acinetobacter phage vB_AbaM_PhT2 TaxID=2690230 RepID=A0A6B9SWU2_9CAUD|nr:baseplate wedge subunit [Acinetobacter phage vB_AbaM_PhT2]QHJ75782.1 baseplate wedge subunit [Acinetobacter phage vB_AbaM_PhT2]
MADLPNYSHGQLQRTVNAIPDVFVGATFQEIKNSLINWLAGQKEFKDYDFTGSRINVLLDLLAYNTLYIQQFSNTAIYESFLRTANLRSSVVQAAQDNSYLPSGMSAAENTIQLRVSNPTNPNKITIPRGTKFLAYARETSADPYPFVVTEDVVAVKDFQSEYWPIVKLAQGRIVRTELLFDRKEPIIIRDQFIDRNHIQVFVDGALWTNWTHKSMITAGSTSTIYYVRETIDGFTEIYFGEGESSISTSSGALEANYIGGLKPTQNASIAIEYIRTDGAKANGARDFTYADTLQYITINEVIENFNDDPDYVGADGGGDPEDKERIREMATVKREAQMRCVTASDYDAFVSERFGSIVQAIQTFTDSDKPGYAFIAIKPKSGLYLTAVQREDIQTYLKEYNLAPITPSVISPNYLFIKHNIRVTYAINKLQESEQWLESRILDQIDRYYIEDVELFNKSFAKSKMLTFIDNADHSIVGSSASIQLVREIQNFYVTPESGIKYYNTVKPRSIESNEFPFIPGGDSDAYNVKIISTDADANNKGSILVGPFIPGDIPAHITPYTANDFNREVSGAQYVYYKIGEANYTTDYVYWNMGALDVTSDKFEVQQIELYSDPSADNIFTRDGSLIVFENDLRPQYTKITLEAITQ